MIPIRLRASRTRLTRRRRGPGQPSSSTCFRSPGAGTARTAPSHPRHVLDRPQGLALGEPSRRRGRAAPGELVETGAQRRALTSKLGRPEPLFAIQVMARVVSPIPGAAVDHLRGLLAAFDPFAGENHFRVRGWRLPGVFLGADLPWRRGRFDRRWTTGRFAPARRGLVTATEIAGLLKPPTATCNAANVLRSGGAIPPAAASAPDVHRAAVRPAARPRNRRGP